MGVTTGEEEAVAEMGDPPAGVTARVVGCGRERRCR